MHTHTHTHTLSLSLWLFINLSIYGSFSIIIPLRKRRIALQSILIDQWNAPLTYLVRILKKNPESISNDCESLPSHQGSGIQRSRKDPVKDQLRRVTLKQSAEAIEIQQLVKFKVGWGGDWRATWKLLGNDQRNTPWSTHRFVAHVAIRRRQRSTAASIPVRSHPFNLSISVYWLE